MPVTHRLSKAQRREQLLDSALAIIRAQGTGALTLAAVAECAGVTKPVAYEHFSSRSGLLIALYKRIDEQQTRTLLHALAKTPKQLPDIAAVISEAYINCQLKIGPEGAAIAAALKGDEQMEAAQEELYDNFVHLCVEALRPYCSLTKNELVLRCRVITGIAETLSNEVLRQKLSKARATALLTALALCALEQ